MTVLGIDLAAGPKKTYACVLRARAGSLCAELHERCDDRRLLELAAGCLKVAVDAPFGWPREFVLALEAHRRFETWPAPDEGAPEVFRAALSFRATDRVVMHTRRPLSVSTDKLGVTAMRCAHLLSRWASAGSGVDRSGMGTFVEVYPAGALVRWELEGAGYKGSDKGPLGRLMGQVSAELPQLELSAADRKLCETTDDAFDALVAALVAQAAQLGLTDGPSPQHRQQAAEEGWIHLPLRGSLALLARPRPEPAARPAEALASRLRESGTALTAHGYTERFEDALLPTFSRELKETIRREVSGKGGAELVRRGDAPPKFQAAHSSACLAANVFGPWLRDRQDVPFGGECFSGEAHLEVECPTGLRGTPPTLDCLVEGPRILAVESKCTETFHAHQANFAPAYTGLVASLADRTWQDEYRRLAEDPRRYRFLDAAQLLKHYLGLRRRYGDRPVTLAYVYWEPTNAAGVAACRVHAAELREFTNRVRDPRVRFLGVSYRELWEDWARLERTTWLRQHVAALKRRYDVAV
jgi:predicted nuclease with RNAse H fold